MTLAVTIVSLVELTLSLVLSVLPARSPAARAAAAVMVVLLAALGTSRLFDTGRAGDHLTAALAVALLSLVAVVGGGPVTAVLLTNLDDPTDDAAALLRGGAWIGVLERTAVFLAVTTGHPAGVAVVVAVKGLGRYPELQSHAGRGAAERFIAGTLASLLWAGGCALLASGLV